MTLTSGYWQWYNKKQDKGRSGNQPSPLTPQESGPVGFSCKCGAEICGRDYEGAKKSPSNQNTILNIPIK